MSQRFEGRNLEEALDAASKALGVERYQLTHRVLVEKRGFLGGMKRVVIEVDVDREAAAPSPQPVLAPPPAVPASGRGERGAGRDRERGRGRRERGGRREGRGDERRGRDRDRHRGGSEPRFVEEAAPAQKEETEHAAAVHAWCDEVIEHAGFDVEVRTEEDEERINVRLYGRDTRRFLDRNGELLDAIQVLANKALVGRRVEKDIELDCADFKERREIDLERRARQVADQVREEGVEQLLPAMTPIERRIVHIALRDDEGVRTESRGDGFYKRVAIVPRDAGAAES